MYEGVLLNMCLGRCCRKDPHGAMGIFHPVDWVLGLHCFLRPEWDPDLFWRCS